MRAGRGTVAHNYTKYAYKVKESADDAWAAPPEARPGLEPFL